MAFERYQRDIIVIWRLNDTDNDFYTWPLLNTCVKLRKVWKCIWLVCIRTALEHTGCQAVFFCFLEMLYKMLSFSFWVVCFSSGVKRQFFFLHLLVFESRGSRIILCIEEEANNASSGGLKSMWKTSTKLTMWITRPMNPKWDGKKDENGCSEYFLPEEAWTLGDL